MSLKYFYDLMSQPSRSLYILLKVNKIPFEDCPVAIRKGEHLTDDFKDKFNRHGKLPFIHHGDFKLSESIAIVRYLSRELKIADHWYPKDSKQQAKVDEYLEWQHLNTRLHNSLYFIHKWIRPMAFGAPPPSKEKEEKLINEINSCLDHIENVWLAPGPFICGDKISVADIFAATEIEQPRMAGFDPRKDRPVLTQWLEKVRSETNPYYDEAHAILNKIAAKTAEKMKAKL